MTEPIKTGTRAQTAARANSRPAIFQSCRALAILLALLAVERSEAQSALTFSWGASGENWGQASPPNAAGTLIAVAAGMHHSLGIRPDGSVVAWGSNWTNQCAVPGNLGACVQVAAGGGRLYNGDNLGHSLALRTDGTVVAWGNNNLGQINVPFDLGPCSMISAGQYHSIAVKRSGTIVCWGDNTYGACNAPAEAGPWRDVSAGGRHSFAVHTNGSPRSWGNNEFGQAAVPGSPSGYTKLSAGRNHSAGVSGSGTVSAWGYNVDGRCSVPADLGTCSDVAAGWFHTVALCTNGLVRAWGSNTNGQTSAPARLAPCSRIAAGGYHSIALKVASDCDLNGTDDYFDLQSGIPDSNSDFIPDTCQGLRSYDQTSANLGTPAGTVLLSHAFTNLATPDNFNSVSLTIRSLGDFDASNEYLTVRIAGKVTGSVFSTTGRSCADGTSEATVLVPREQMLSAISQGSLLVQLLPTPAVSEPDCPSGWLTVRLAYLGFDPESDCDSNGLFDLREIGISPALDCDRNLRLDRCQIADDPSLDCDSDGITNECEIESGAPDEDLDGRPDTCQYALGDFDLDHSVGTADLALLILYLGDPTAPFGDLDEDGQIDTADLSLLLLLFGPA
jgi:hypothetical protein